MANFLAKKVATVAKGYANKSLSSTFTEMYRAHGIFSHIRVNEDKSLWYESSNKLYKLNNFNLANLDF